MGPVAALLQGLQRVPFTLVSYKGFPSYILKFLASDRLYPIEYAVLNIHIFSQTVLIGKRISARSVHEGPGVSQLSPGSSPILVTCGLPYANGQCHLGHLRTYVPADIFVRGLRKMGKDPLFVCGTDAHGTPIVVNAEAQGITPKELVAEYHHHFDQVFKAMEVEFDYFGDTDNSSNQDRTQQMVKALMDKGYVYPMEIELAFCPKCGRFLPDRYVEGICPYCGKPARGDECDQG